MSVHKLPGCYVPPPQAEEYEGRSITHEEWKALCTIVGFALVFGVVFSVGFLLGLAA